MDLKLTQEVAQRRATRQNLVRTADRSEKIRTYNFPQNRLTDHRVAGLTLHQLDQVMEGKIDQIVEAVNTHFQTEKLKQESAV